MGSTMNKAQQLKADGFSVFTIAAKCGMSIADVYRELGETPLKLVPSEVSIKAHAKPSEADQEQIRSLYSAGSSVRQIAAATGWSRHRVRAALGDLYSDDRVKLTPAQLSDLYDYFDSGHDTADLAAQFKVSIKTITRAMKVYQDAISSRDRRAAEATLLKAGWTPQRVAEFFSKRS
jgi:hypothetical protein